MKILEDKTAFNKIVCEKSIGIKKIYFRGDGGVFSVYLNECELLNRNYPKYSEVVITCNFETMKCYIENSPFGEFEIGDVFSIKLVTSNGQFSFFHDLKTEINYVIDSLYYTSINIENTVDINKYIYKFEKLYLSEIEEVIQGVWLTARNRLISYLSFLYGCSDESVKIGIQKQFTLTRSLNNSKDILDVNNLNQAKTIIFYNSSYTKVYDKYKNTRLSFLESELKDYIIFSDELNGQNVVEDSISNIHVSNLIDSLYYSVSIDDEINLKLIEIEMQISKFFGVILPIYNMLRDSYVHFENSKKVWRSIFEKTTPKDIFYLAGYNNVGLVYTANMMGITTKEYQYSAITRLHPAYNMQDSFLQVFKPKIFYAWSNYFLQHYNIKTSEKHVLGYDFEINSLRKHKRTKNILIISQPSIANDVFDFVPKLSKLIKHGKIIIKPHRKELYKISNEYLELEKYDNVEIIKNDEIVFGDLLYNACAVIGSSSTGLYEASSVGLKVFLIGKDKESYIGQDLINKYNFYIYENFLIFKLHLYFPSKLNKSILSPIDFNVLQN